MIWMIKVITQKLSIDNKWLQNNLKDKNRPVTEDIHGFMEAIFDKIEKEFYYKVTSFNKTRLLFVD